jgi:hypothetical protein
MVPQPCAVHFATRNFAILSGNAANREKETVLCESFVRRIAGGVTRQQNHESLRPHGSFICIRADVVTIAIDRVPQAGKGWVTYDRRYLG